MRCHAGPRIPWRRTDGEIRMALNRDGGSTLFSASMAGTLRLIVYLALASVLMVFDHRGGWLGHVRYASAMVVEPLYRLAALPSKGMHAARIAFADRKHLTTQNQRLREGLLLANARLNRMAAVAAQNEKLKQLLTTQHSLGMKVQLAHVIGVDLGAFRHRVVLGVGAREGVSVGQVVMDAHGIMGQVIEVLPSTCVVMLITDPEHAVPVMDVRSGVRAVAYGSRQPGHLSVPNIPVSADVRAGDALVSSGLGGRFPQGFPVGTVKEVAADPSGMYLQAWAKPAAELERSGDVLLLRDQAPPVGPPSPPSPMGPPAGLSPAPRDDSGPTGRTS